jgi:hypothetical protein
VIVSGQSLLTFGGQFTGLSFGLRLYQVGSCPLSWIIPVMPKCMTGRRPSPESVIQKLVLISTCFTMYCCRGVDEGLHLALALAAGDRPAFELSRLSGMSTPVFGVAMWDTGKVKAEGGQTNSS